MNTITPCLWFDGNAEEAVAFYLSVFRDSLILETTYYPDDPQHPAHEHLGGKVLTILFQIKGCQFTALNAGPDFHFNEAVSFQIPCTNQKEIDYYWEKLSEGGDVHAQQCGWLKDKFGLSWQIVPNCLIKMFAKGDNATTARVMKALLTMKKLDIETLEAVAKPPHQPKKQTTTTQ
ncbi:MAG: VOC family protein [Verrucomicrobiota bacterium]